MIITNHNYEAFLTDFLDGKLNAAQIADLQSFVMLHPELGNWSDFTSGFNFLKPETIVFQDKCVLKRSEIQAVGTIHENNYHEYFVTAIDKQLSEPEQANLSEFISLNPELASELTALQKMKFTPDLSIHYPDKNSLKHLIVPLYAKRVFSYAASVLILISLFFWWMMRDISVDDWTTATAENKIKVETNAPNADSETASANTLTETVHKIAQPKQVQIVSKYIGSKRSEVVLPELVPRNASELSLTPLVSFIEDDFMLFYFDGLEYLASLGKIHSSDKTSVFGLVSQNIVRKTVKIISDRTVKAENKLSKISSEGNISFWNLAEMGVKTYNNLTDSELDLSRTKNQDGKLTGVRFHSERLAVSKTMDVDRAKK